MAVFFIGVVASEVHAADGDKLPAPAAADQAAALRRVHETYATVSAGKETPGQKLALAERVGTGAAADGKAPADRFAMFQFATDTAAAAGDGEAACNFIDQWAGYFVIDPIALKRDAIKTAAGSVGTEDTALGNTAIAIITSDEAIAEDRYPLADELAKLAGATAGKARNKSASEAAVAQLQRARSIESVYLALKAVRAKLTADPADAPSLEKIGRFECFVKGDWQAGLGHLAAGSDKILAELASDDLKAATATDDPDVDQQLADRWWAVSLKATANERRAIQWRSVRYARRIIPTATGAALATAQQHVAAMRSQPPERVVVDEFTIDADVDGETELHITPHGIWWKEGAKNGAEKPGRSNGTNLPTYVNDIAWMPVWGNPREARGEDRTDVLFMPIARGDFDFDTIAIGGNSKTRDPSTIDGIDKRDPIEISRQGVEQIVSIPDRQGGDRWYRLRLHRK